MLTYRELDTFASFSSIFYMGDNFCDFQFPLLQTNTLLKKGHSKRREFAPKRSKTRGLIGPEIAHLDYTDLDVTLCHGGQLGYKIRLPLAIQNLMLFEEFQDCHHGRHLA